MEEKAFKSFIAALVDDKVEARLVELIIAGLSNDNILAELVKISQKRQKGE
jgi:hypothetical protein